MRKRKKLLRVAIAAALMVVAVPSAAMAYVLDDDGGGPAGTRTEKAGCSLDPRILRMEPQLCSDNRVAPDPEAVKIVEEPARPPEILPTSSGDSGNAIAWWMVGIALAAGGSAGLVVGLRRGRPHALS